MSEPGEKTTDRPALLLDTILRKASLFHQNPEIKANAMDEVQQMTSAFTPIETARFTARLLGGLTRIDNTWNRTRRNAAIDMLEIVDYSSIPGKNLLDAYIRALGTQTGGEYISPLLDDLFRAGRIFSKHFPQEVASYEALEKAFSEIKKSLSPDEHAELESGSRYVYGELHIPNFNIEGIGDSDEKRREMPSFEPEQQVLHDAFLKVTDEQRTFKKALWEYTKDFQSDARGYGIDIDSFWNLSNPEKVSDALMRVKLQGLQEGGIFDKQLVDATGTTLAEFTHELARVLADEVLRSAASTVKILRKNGSDDFKTTVDRIRVRLQSAKDLPAKARKKIARDATQFLTKYEIPFDNPTYDSLLNALTSEEVLLAAEKRYSQREYEKNELLSALENAFDLHDYNPDFALISRTRDDLFLGDLTGDCTAYHMQAGINAWSVPIWLTDPGFNIFKISEGGQLVAKAGIILGVADGKPVLVIDSIEVGTEMRDKEVSVIKIREGLAFLESWATEIGLTDVLIQIMSNSSELDEIVGGMTQDVKHDKVSVLGGLQGVREVRSRFSNESVEEKIYLQSVSKLVESEERKDLLREFEDLIADIVVRQSKSEANEMSLLLREGNWDKFFSLALQNIFPGHAEHFSDQWEVYEPYTIDQSKRIFGEASLQEMLEEIEREYMSSHFSSEQPDDEDYISLASERNDLLELVSLFGRMEIVGLTPAIAIEQLYGAKKLDDGTLHLSKNLKRLTI